MLRTGPGPDDRPDGVPPHGDDRILAVIETVAVRLRDAKGVDRETGHLFTVSRQDLAIAGVALAGEIAAGVDFLVGRHGSRVGRGDH